MLRSSHDVVVVPRGLLGALWGCWPFWAVLGVPIGQDLVGGAFSSAAAWTAIALAATSVRSLLWARHRRRNRVEVDGSYMVITHDGGITRLSVDDVVSGTWFHGFWTATFDRMGHYTAMELTDSSGARHFVELLLPRRRDQRRALTELGRVLPLERWLVTWPFAARKDQLWYPDRTAIAPR
jgi:hypothetical protein